MTKPPPRYVYMITWRIMATPAWGGDLVDEIVWYEVAPSKKDAREAAQHTANALATLIPNVKDVSARYHIDVSDGEPLDHENIVRRDEQVRIATDISVRTGNGPPLSYVETLECVYGKWPENKD